jgi:hypothetical protein
MFKYQRFCSACEAPVPVWAVELDVEWDDEPAGLCEPCAGDPTL